MDWKVIVMVCAIALAGILVWRMQKLKRDVCDFADGLEHSLDEILQGRKPEESADAQDSLLGKVNEKLGRVFHVLETKAEENLRGKQQMKELNKERYICKEKASMCFILYVTECT